MPLAHDRIFRSVFGQPEHAAAALRTLLPAEMTRPLDWSSLRLEAADLHGQDLKNRHADLLFSVQLARRPAFLYLLLEHKSRPERFTVLQVLGYVVRVWERFVREHPRARRLPPVLPIVVSHHPRGWRYRADLLSRIDLDPALLPHFQPFLPDFRFVLDDVAATTDAAVRARGLSPLGRVSYLCFRRIRRGVDVASALRYLEKDIRAALAAHGAAALEPVFAYMLGASRDAEASLADFAARLGSESEAIVKTSADKLRAEGRAEGRAEARAEMLLEQLAALFGPLPPAIESRVRSARDADVRVWAKRVLTAASLDDVLAET